LADRRLPLAGNTLGAHRKLLDVIILEDPGIDQVVAVNA
jgi:hypothetical protein